MLESCSLQFINMCACGIIARMPINRIAPCLLLALGSRIRTWQSGGEQADHVSYGKGFSQFVCVMNIFQLRKSI